MRKAIVLACAAVFLLRLACVAHANDPVAVVTTTDGRTFKDVKVFKIIGDKVLLIHAEGSDTVPLDLLPDEARKNLGLRTREEQAAFEAEQAKKGLVKSGADWVTPDEKKRREAAATKSQEIPAPLKQDAASAAAVTSEEKPADPWSGFRGVKWGARIEDLPEMALVQDAGNMKYYSRKSERLSIGTVQLKDIILGFYKGRFATLRVQAEGFANWVRLRGAIFAFYGEGHQDDKDIQEWDWRAPQWPGSKDVFMSLKYSEATDHSTLWMFYMPICDQQHADEMKAARDAPKDF